MDRKTEAAEHARKLRAAMAQAQFTSQDLAVALGVSKRTIVNWISRTDPTMPNDRMLAQMSKLLPGYAEQGDPVEIAVRQSELVPFRQSKLVAMYQELLHEQALEDRALAQ